MSNQNDDSSGNLPSPDTNGNGHQPVTQVFQNLLQLNQFIKESEAQHIVQMEAQLRRSNPSLADRWIEDALEVSKHRRDVEKEMMEVIKREQRDEFRTEIANILAGVASLTLVLGTTGYIAFLGHPGTAAGVAGLVVAVVTVFRLGKAHQAPKKPAGTSKAAKKKTSGGRR